MASVILRLPAMNVDRRIENFIVRGEALAQSCIIVEQFECRAWLPLGLDRAIVLTATVASSPDHCDHCTIGPHSDECRLSRVFLISVFGQRRLHDACRQLLQTQIKRRADANGAAKHEVTLAVLLWTQSTNQPVEGGDDF